MIASNNVLTQVVNIRIGINSLVTRVHHVEVIDMYGNLLHPPNTDKNLTNVTNDTKNWLQHLAENLR